VIVETYVLERDFTGNRRQGARARLQHLWITHIFQILSALALAFWMIFVQLADRPDPVADGHEIKTTLAQIAQRHPALITIRPPSQRISGVLRRK